MESTDAPCESRTRRAGPMRGWAAYLAVLLTCLAFYVAGTQRSGPAWQDSGLYQWRILNFDLFGWNGLALSHPLLIVLAKAFSFLPFGPPAWRMNLVSALAASVAVANVALLLRRLSGRWSLGLLAAGGLFVSHSLFWLATICESQALLVALFTVELNVLLSLVARPAVPWAFVLGLVNGVALTAHNLALLALPAYGAVVLGLCASGKLAWRSLAMMVLGWLIGAGGLLAMVAWEAADPRVGLWGAVGSALFGRRWQGSVLGASWKSVAMGLGYVLYNFPNLMLPLAVVGLLAMARRIARPLAWAFGYLAAVYFLFAVRYRVPDQFMFFLPFYAMVTLLAGVGLDRLTRLRPRRWLLALVLAGVVLTPVLYAAAPAAWSALDLPLPGRKDLPYRDPAAYWLIPWKGDEDSAARFSRQVLSTVPEGSTIIADSTALYPLLFVRRTELAGRTVRLLGSGEAGPEDVPAGTPDVFCVSNRPGYYPAWLDDAAVLEPFGPSPVVFAVIWR